MEDKNVVLSLKFLVDDFRFEYQFYSTNGNDEYYNYRNEYGCFSIYQWKQFGDLVFYVENMYGKKRINFRDYYPEILDKFKKSHKGLKCLFKDSTPDYWKTVKEILQTEIMVNKTLFGLRISEKKTVFNKDNFEIINPTEYALRLKEQYLADPSLWDKSVLNSSNAEWMRKLSKNDYSQFWKVNCACCGKKIDRHTQIDCYATQDRITWLCNECYAEKFIKS